ncbi:DUF4270 family protein [Chitinophaga vietnamensis]|uniref:DUF4270 family protein n=1 Tax=Chitinophaga vietnamensis TaxID=2593957 RepID=UPI001177E14A|nr:DUF4270 family protein [Chitinophaga vietnamensis]
MNHMLHRITTCFTVLLAVLFTSCSKTGFTYDNIGGGDQQADYILSDTLTVKMNSIQYDSVATSGLGAVLLGQNNDPLFGKITTSSFFQIAPPTSFNIPTYGSQYDSMALIMNTNGYAVGDTLAPQDFRVYRITQNMQLPTGVYSFYNKSSFSTESTPIGSFTGMIRPNTDKTISVKMSDALGSQLFSMLRDKSPDITASNTFLEFFKGLSLQPGPQSNTVTGFNAKDSSLYMRLYYHINELITTVKYVDFKLTGNNLQFNQVKYDRTGTAIAGFNNTVKQLPSAATGNTGYMQTITGTATRIDIPYLKNMLQLGQYVKIMKVLLTVEPIRGSYLNYRLPPRLALCEADKTNAIIDTLSYGSLVVDNLYNEHTYYSYDITNYFNAQLSTTDYNARGLMLTPSGRTILDRLVIGDQQNAKNKIKIQVYYLLYK